MIAACVIDVCPKLVAACALDLRSAFTILGDEPGLGEFYECDFYAAVDWIRGVGDRRARGGFWWLHIERGIALGLRRGASRRPPGSFGPGAQTARGHFMQRGHGDMFFWPREV